MLHDGKSRRVAIVGGVRIPFCRAHSVYRDSTNQDMMTAVLSGLVRQFDLKGQTLGDVALGAVIKHSKDWNLARECVIGSGLSLQNARRRYATRLRHQHRGVYSHWQQDRTRSDRGGYCRRH